MIAFVIALFVGPYDRDTADMIRAAAEEQIDLSLVDPYELAVFEVEVPAREAFGWHTGGVSRAGYLVLDGWWASYEDAADAVICLGMEGL